MPRASGSQCPFCFARVEVDAAKCPACGRYVGTDGGPGTVADAGPFSESLVAEIGDAFEGAIEPEEPVRTTALRLDAGGSARAGRISVVDLNEVEADDGVQARTGLAKYERQKLLGQGGMGEVHLVRDSNLNRKVALKVMRPDAKVSRSRFIEEAQILAQLEHPNIVPLHELGIDDGQPYATLRYVRGKTLSCIIGDLRADPKSYSLTRLMQIFQQICQAVSYAHAKGVVHRDLKPANVMIGEHGEVQVLDWGLALVLADCQSDVTVTAVSPQPEPGTIFGTPGYLAPEQALGESVDGRADIYALGVILYQLLTHERLFVGSVYELITSTIRREVVTPRKRAPHLNIPRELEDVCLRALHKDAGDRQQSATELIAQLQEWLEAAADREKRHELSEQRASEGERRLGEYRTARAELDTLVARSRELEQQFSGWQSVSEKRALFAAQDAVQAADEGLASRATAVVDSLSKALEHEPDNTRARTLLADYYWERFNEAEKSGESGRARYLRGLVERYHDRRYAEQLRGDGSLSLTTEPSDAELCLYELIERDLQLVRADERALGRAPLDDEPLAMGSYLVVARAPGHRAVRYPVHIDRCRQWRGHVSLLPEDAIGDGFVLVPGGPFLFGRDATLREIDVGDYLIGAYPVTMAEYLQFINALVVADGLEAARRRAPRRSYNDPVTYLVASPDGGLMLPSEDREGDQWDDRWPALAISWQDTVEYCRWRSERDGRTYRLPTEVEWEKAARGVDGRVYPWGSRFDPSLCNMKESREDRSGPVPVDAITTDVSIYGVYGTAGNVTEWTSSVGTSDDRESSIVRGGAWNVQQAWSECSARYEFEHVYVNESLGFRLVVELPGRS